ADSTIDFIPRFILLHRPFATRRARGQPSLRGLHCRAPPNFSPFRDEPPLLRLLDLRHVTLVLPKVGR
ncbi:MAG TPA: hypothetical protein D7H76_05315, partial [Candidatus Poseidoniales archaeon]